jgi:ATP-binding cassette subfamily B protein
LPTPRGSIFIDGVDVCDLPLPVLRRTIGYAQQDSFLFSTTVARNIGYSLDDTDTAEAQASIRARARDAQVLDEALALPDGFDTVVGERGVQLSGGQKQRIALARALMWQPEILVLDDPIFAVDARTKPPSWTPFNVRPNVGPSCSLPTGCGRAVRPDRRARSRAGGRRGTHDELIRNDGLYARFAEEQRLEGEIVKLESVPATAPAGAA